MKKLKLKLIWGAVIIILIIIIAQIIIFFSHNIIGDLKTLQDKNKSLKCVYLTKDSEGEIISTTYLAANKIRTDYIKNIKSGQQFIALKESAYSNGREVYAWSNKIGSKMSWSDYLQKQKNFAVNLGGLFNPENKLKYQCTSWQVDESYFKVSDLIKFSELKIADICKNCVDNSDCLRQNSCP